MTRFQWLDDESRVQEMLCGELGPCLWELFSEVRLIDGGLELLRLLHLHPNTLRTIDDFAFHLHKPAPVVEKGLRAMVKLGLVRRIDAASVVVFGITRDPDRRRLLVELCDWQDRWHKRLAQIEQVVDGKFPVSALYSDAIGSVSLEFGQARQ